MSESHKDHHGLHVDEEKWEAWTKAKTDYEDDPEGIDTSGMGQLDEDPSLSDDDSGTATEDEEPARTDEPVNLDAVEEAEQQGEDPSS